MEAAPSLPTMSEPAEISELPLPTVTVPPARMFRVLVASRLTVESSIVRLPTLMAELLLSVMSDSLISSNLATEKVLLLSTATTERSTVGASSPSSV